jgi:hypothetical protein
MQAGDQIARASGVMASSASRPRTAITSHSSRAVPPAITGKRAVWPGAGCWMVSAQIGPTNRSTEKRSAHSPSTRPTLTPPTGLPQQACTAACTA